MKFLLLTLVSLFTTIAFNQEGKKYILAENKDVKVYLIEKEQMTTGDNRILLVPKIKRDYSFSCSGAMILKKDGFWVIRPSKGVAVVTINVFYLEDGKSKNVLTEKIRIEDY